MIAEVIGVSPSTISREIRRNSTPNGHYIWFRADDFAKARKSRSPGNRRIAEALRQEIIYLLTTEQWSPRQISGWLARQGKHVSHETIYAIIRNDTTGKLAQHCRHKMKRRCKKKRKQPAKTTTIKNRVSIHERPIEADGTRFGDFEMDLIVDKHSHAILVLMERSTNFLMMEKLPHGKKAKPIAQAVWRMLLPYKHILKSITTDNGSEFAEHQWITQRLGVPVFFADPYCSWQKGGVENINKLIRQYIPKGTNLSRVTDKRIRTIKHKINARPRQKLNFFAPKDVFFNSLP